MGHAESLCVDGAVTTEVRRGRGVGVHARDNVRAGEYVEKQQLVSVSPLDCAENSNSTNIVESHSSITFYQDPFFACLCVQ